MPSKFSKFFLILLLLSLSSSLKMILSIEAFQEQCFYEPLHSQQKYSIDTEPKSPGPYQVSIFTVFNQHKQLILQRQAYSSESLHIHKITPSNSTYSFCLKNEYSEQLRIGVKIESGLELMELQMLPQQSDSENLQRELFWLQSQKQKVLASLQRIEQMRSASEDMDQILPARIMGVAAVGLLVMLVVNLVFYRQIKQTFKDRKLI